ncbi:MULTISPECIES: YybH family protein [unclassified Acinetobacter]|uniref:YybH family protein n=1 Tax=unclassified Acinetobacter TaxID=196816 RepID=UPI0029340E3D|nr:MULTISPECIES: nuclear transport factor 2 family protein [unclassified Acinetobacter]WOE31344.1 nuclear transport factor 2 family protein [Acinetobacter sp. SAAs470]WOE39540.1 nuclear transport factor 2 family protein [Acinetobacter sp. SAAs474]
MPAIFIGHEYSAEEILFKIKQWDDAIAQLDLATIIDLCEKDIHIFDLTQQVEGTEELKYLWQYYKLYFSENIRVYRRKITIFAQPHLAFMYCDSKIDHANLQQSLHVPWCRTTFCFQKKHTSWKIAHQHISLAQSW